MTSPHGTYSRYASRHTRCRCDQCREAARLYMQSRRHGPATNTAAVRLASQSWREHAACQGQPVEWWYPGGPDSTRQKISNRIVDAPGIPICRSCPVRLSCLDHAISTNEPDGIWGGLTPTSRDHYAARRSQTADRLRQTLTALNGEVAS